MSPSTRNMKRSVEETKKMKASGPAEWTEEDEVSLLKGVVEFQESQQLSPYAAMGEFLDFVKPCIHFNVNRKQLTDKLWRLKNKFLTNKYDSNVDHHAKLLELSKAITSWGEHANISLDAPNTADPNVGNVVVDVGDSDKLLNVAGNEKKGKLVSGDGGNAEKENVGMDDEVCVDKGFKGVTNKRRLLGRDGENVKGVLVGKCSKKKGKLVSGDGRNGEKENVAIDDEVSVDKGLKQVTKKRTLLGTDGENVKGVMVEKCSKKKGKVVVSEDRNDKGDDVAVDDVGAGKDELLMEDKSKGGVVTDDQNAEDDVIANEVVNDVPSPKKKGKKRVKALGDEGVSREANRDDLKDFKSMFPELINMLELETLSRLPQPLKKKWLMDTMNTMGWEKANELEEGWADVRLMKMELEVKKLELRRKQMDLIVEAARRESRP